MSDEEDVFTNRIRLFMDFWNFQLTLNECAHSKPKVDWLALPTWLASKAADVLLRSGERDSKYIGGHVYISYNPWNPEDKKLLKWVNEIVARAPGIQTVIKKRKPKSPPICQACHQQISICPHCGEVIRRTGEKGVDTGLVTDMIRLAWEDAYDAALLISSDGDFIPAVRFIQSKGKRIIHVGFPPNGAELQRECWDSVNLVSALDEIPLRA